MVNEPLSSTTVHKNVKMIKGFFKWCVDRGYLSESPADFLVNKRPVRPLGQGKACTDEELELLLAAARFKPRDLALLTLLAESGCRAGEAAKLKLADLELDHRVGLIFARERVAPRVTQFYLGHTNITTTLEYYQDVDESDLRMAGRLLSRKRSDWREETKQNPAARLLKPRTGS